NDWPIYEEFLTGNNGLVEPKAIAIAENGSVLVLDGNQVKVFDEQKDLFKIYGKLDGEAGKDQGEFNGPRDIAFDSLGRLWVIDAGNYRVQILDKKGQYLFEIGSYGSLPGQFNSPSRIAIQGERAYVLDSGNYRIQIFAVNDGNFLGSFGIRGQDSGQFEEPTSIAIDDEGRVYVGDRGYQNHVLQFDANGNFLDQIGYHLVNPTEHLGKFTIGGPVALVIRDGKVYAADGGDRILVFSLDGSYEYEFGTNGSRVGRFNNVAYLKFDKHGRLYVLEETQKVTEAFTDRDFTRGQRIQRITPPVEAGNVKGIAQRSKAERDL
ncbi:MAG: NHL repeat-containing protein, partial [Candidatus Omnitrophota bacterium]|nr:NHL repeat-containing protein [Candidatus Omnitrophota bacterium]